MTLPDIVFPGFLFIVGMSIPLALRRERGAPKLLGRIGIRTLSLLVMGVMMVNMDEYDPWYRGLWGLCAYLGMIAAFAVIPREPGKRRTTFLILRGVGLAALALLSLLYHDESGRHLVLGPLFNPEDTIWLRHSWWGILGLIAWAYLTASLIFLMVGRRREWLIGATLLLALLYVTENKGLFARVESREWLAWATPILNLLQNIHDAIDHHVSFGECLGSLASITMAGCCLGMLVAPDSKITGHGERLRWALLFGLGMVLAGVLFDPLYGINKIRATPAWCFYNAAIMTFTWVVLYWMMDMRGWRKWSVVIAPAGANPLLAYILHPLVLGIGWLTGLKLTFYKQDSLGLTVNILGCLAMAFAIVGLTGLIGRVGYRMKA